MYPYGKVALSFSLSGHSLAAKRYDRIKKFIPDVSLGRILASGSPNPKGIQRSRPSKAMECPSKFYPTGFAGTGKPTV
jgi:hypothetical protein